MDANELKKYRDELAAEKQQEIESATKAIMAKYDRKIQAVCVLLEDDQAPNKIGQNGHNGRTCLRSTNERASNIHQAVRESIDATPTPTFSSKTLFDYIGQVYPGMAEGPADLSGPLWRLRKAGCIQVVRHGKGRRAAIYRRADLDDPTNASPGREAEAKEH